MTHPNIYRICLIDDYYDGVRIEHKIFLLTLPHLLFCEYDCVYFSGLLFSPNCTIVNSPWSYILPRGADWRIFGIYAGAEQVSTTQRTHAYEMHFCYIPVTHRHSDKVFIVNQRDIFNFKVKRVALTTKYSCRNKYPLSRDVFFVLNNIIVWYYYFLYLVVRTLF